MLSPVAEVVRDKRRTFAASPTAKGWTIELDPLVGSLKDFKKG